MNTKTPLAELFPDTKFVSYSAYDELRAFASHYDEMRYDEFKNRVVFRSDTTRGGVIFTISVSQSGAFKGTIFNVNDDENDDDLFDTGRQRTIDEVFEVLQVGWAAIIAKYK